MALRQPVYSCIVVLGALALASCEQSLTDVGYEKWKSAPHYVLVPGDAAGIPPADLSPAVIYNKQTYATLKGMTALPQAKSQVEAWVAYHGDQAGNNITFTASGEVGASNNAYAEGLGDAQSGIRNYQFDTVVPLGFLPDCGETLSASTVHSAWKMLRYPLTLTWGKVFDTSAQTNSNVACTPPAPPSDQPAEGGPPTSEPPPTPGTAWPAPPQVPIDQGPYGGLPFWCETVYDYDGLGNLTGKTVQCYAI